MKSHQSLLLLVCTLAFSSHCASGQSFTNRTYEVVTGTFTWQQAREDAERRGGHLATITSQAELDHILSLSLPFPPIDGYWLGATDEGHEGTWEWITGEPWGFSFWSNGEPNDLNGEDYLTASAGVGHHWNDWGETQDALSYYLLEIDELPCTPRKARATSQVVNGFVVGATVTDGGCGYTNPPTVLIQGGGGMGAEAHAIIANGEVTAIQITDAGCCYTNAPKIVIGSPPFVPTVSIAVSQVNVIQNVVLGWKYVLENSTNGVNWTATGPEFVADSETIVSEFSVDTVGRFFRLRVVP